jgi:hypothetical protein
MERAEGEEARGCVRVCTHIHADRQAGIYMHSNKQFCGYRFAAIPWQLGFRRLGRRLAGMGANLLFGKLAVGYVMH